MLLLAPLVAHAAGLGRITVHSALGQPLRAEIEIVSLQPGEEDSLTVRLATAEAFRQAGIEISPALIGLRLAVDTKGPRPVIRVGTSQPVNEPFLDMLVELQWATGRLVREYTFLLDPP
ncbi:MAG: pilus assembly protein FimV, partial [Pseudomonadota bacterium]